MSGVFRSWPYAAITHLKNHLPDGLETSEMEALLAVVLYFDEIYVRRTTRPGFNANGNAIRRSIPATFPPDTWIVYEKTLIDGDRTNNYCESWNVSLREIVEHQKDNVMVHTSIEKNNLAERPENRVRRATQDLNSRLKNLCYDYQNDFKSGDLNGIKHNIDINKN